MSGQGKSQKASSRAVWANTPLKSPDLTCFSRGLRFGPLTRYPSTSRAPCREDVPVLLRPIPNTFGCCMRFPAKPSFFGPDHTVGVRHPQPAQAKEGQGSRPGEQRVPEASKARRFPGIASFGSHFVGRVPRMTELAQLSTNSGKAVARPPVSCFIVAL